MKSVQVGFVEDQNDKEMHSLAIKSNCTWGRILVTKRVNSFACVPPSPFPVAFLILIYV